MSVVENSSILLIGSKTSPYVRRFRIWLAERVKFDFKIVDYLNVPEDAAYLKSISPINKIPVLIDDGKKIFESRVIANYLMRKYDWEPLTFEEENILSMSDAATDVTVNLFLLKRGGIDLEAGNWYIERQKDRLPGIFNELEPWAKTRDAEDPAHWNYATASLLSYVEWAAFRGMADFSSHPGLGDFVKRFSKKPMVAETSPRA
jgi:glutathione S-transferase